MMMDWLQVVWHRRPRVLLRKQGMTVLDAFKGCLTLDVISFIHAMNTDFTVIPKRMTLYLQVLDVVVNKPCMYHLKQLYSDPV
jgi:hypothetical protein